MDFSVHDLAGRGTADRVHRFTLCTPAPGAARPPPYGRHSPPNSSAEQKATAAGSWFGMTVGFQNDRRVAMAGGWSGARKELIVAAVLILVGCGGGETMKTPAT